MTTKEAARFTWEEVLSGYYHSSAAVISQPGCVNRAVLLGVEIWDLTSKFPGSF